MTEDNATPDEQASQNDPVRMRFPRRGDNSDSDVDIDVAEADVIAVAWHKQGAIGDALEVYAGDGSDEQIVVMQDILGTDDEGEDVFGPAFAVSTEALDDFEFTTPDGDALSADSVEALARRRADTE